MASHSNLHYVHRQLSALHHAAVLTLEDIYFVFVRLEWNQYTYLTLEVECYQKDARKVADRLQHGLLVSEYDYRMRSVSIPTGHKPNDLIKVTGTVDLDSKGFLDSMIELAA